MKVCLINKYSGAGGGELALLDHARDLRGRGAGVCVALHNRGPLCQALRADGIPYTLWPDSAADRELTRIGRIVTGQVRTAFLSAVRGVGATWFYTLEDLLYGSWSMRLSGRKVFYRSQGEIYSQCRSGILSAWQVRAALSACHRVACTTRYERQFLLEEFHQSAERVAYVPLGIDCRRFHPAPRGPRERLTLGMFGRLVPWKGHEVFLRALAGLDDVTGWEAMIVGDATYGSREYPDRLMALAGELGLAERVRWCGFRRDVEDLMRQCDVVVHCSHREPFGLVVAEAMASGACVVAADVEGPREVIEDGRTGLLTPPGDAEALRAAIRRVMTDERLRRDLAGSARQHVCERFDRQRSLDALYEITTGGGEPGRDAVEPPAAHAVQEREWKQAR